MINTENKKQNLPFIKRKGEGLYEYTYQMGPDENPFRPISASHEILMQLDEDEGIIIIP